MGTERAASDVFALLSDETRLDVLRTVARAQREEKRTGVAALSFSEIYERVDVDGTSKLSYHLGELTGTFLRKRSDGYAFTHAGEQLVRFVLAENYRSPSAVGPIETDGCCLHCGAAALRAGIEDQYFLIRCSSCERPVFSYKIRPAQARSREGAALIDAVVREQVGDLRKARRGVCPDCAGRVETEVLDAGGGPIPDDSPVSLATLSECQECLRFLSAPLTHAVAYHPASVAFHWEHGTDILGRGIWELHRNLRDDRWTAERTDAGRGTYRVEFRREDASLRLFLDDHAAVTGTERVRRRDRSERRS